MAYLNSLKVDKKGEEVFHQNYKYQDYLRYVRVLLAFKPNLNGFENCLHDNNEFKIRKLTPDQDDCKLTFIVNGVTRELNKSILFLKNDERAKLQQELFTNLCNFDAVLTDYHTLGHCFTDHHIFDQWSCIYRELSTMSDAISAYHR